MLVSTKKNGETSVRKEKAKVLSLCFRYESGRRKNYIPENCLPMADIRLGVLRSETKHGTELPRVVADRHQQTRREPHTSSVKGKTKSSPKDHTTLLILFQPIKLTDNHFF